VNLFGTGLHMTLEGSNPAAAEAEVRRALASRGIGIESLHPVEPTIEDVFFQLSTEAKGLKAKS
jgi:hypothetical protein